MAAGINWLSVAHAAVCHSKKGTWCDTDPFLFSPVHHPAISTAVCIIIMLWFDGMISGVVDSYLLSLLIFHIVPECLSVIAYILCNQHIFHCWISTMIIHQQPFVQTWVSVRRWSTWWHYQTFVLYFFTRYLGYGELNLVQSLPSYADDLPVLRQSP